MASSSSSNTNTGGGHDVEKKLDGGSPMAFAGFGLRNLTTAFFAVIALCYVLYSSNLLLTNSPTTSDSDCSLDMISTSTNSSPQLVLHDEQVQLQPLEDGGHEEQTDLKHIVFCIAGSSKLWQRRKQYIKQWWRPRHTRGVVWLDKPIRTRRGDGLPEIRVSSSTAQFPYRNSLGHRWVLRLSRIVSDTLRLNKPNVRWFVVGNDDTVFVVENVLRVLSSYDHNQFYYIGSSSESHIQNLFFSYQMANSGGGFAISFPLAVALTKMQDRCLHRNADLYGSDDRIQACMAELGVPLTREPGFHQYDVNGDLLGLLAAHPVTPLVSLHHLDVVEPLFPGTSRAKALQRLFRSVSLDSASIMQQSICYDKLRWWSISVSWGYVVQVSRGLVSPRELERPARTFRNWNKNADHFEYTFNSRPVAEHPCQQPFTFYIGDVRYDKSKKQTVSTHYRRRARYPSCSWKMSSPATIDTIIVFKKPDPLRWRKSPQKDCCRVLPSGKGSAMHISVDKCGDVELSEF